MLAIAVASSFCHAEGFIEDSKSTLLIRNFFMTRDFVDNGPSQALPGPNKRGMAKEWTQSFILDYSSGYTPGPVGFGVDAIGMFALKLDGGRGSYGTQLLPTHDGNHPADNFGRLAAAAKAKWHSTDLKVGEWAPVLPVLRSDDARSLPQTFEGALITSREVPGLTLNAGQFTGNSQRDDASMEKMSANAVGTVVHGKNTVESDHFNLAGAEYTFNENRTLVGAWYAQLEDIYQQRYFQVLHKQPLGADWQLTSNIGYFMGNADGDALGGDQDNRTWSGMFSLKHGGNTFYVGLQHLSGDSGWQRISGTSGGSVANDSYAWSYDGAQERSWQVRHDYDFAAVGVPGLGVMNRFIKGTNVHQGTVDDGEDRGRESEISYVVQSGPLKLLGMKWRNSTLRRNYGNTNSFNENRLIFQYPLSLF